MRNTMKMVQMFAVVALFAACGSDATGVVYVDNDYYTVEVDVFIDNTVEETTLGAPCKTDGDCQKLPEAICRVAHCAVPPDEEYGVCNFETVATDATPCNDEQPCTQEDKCVQGTCVGTWKNCNDDNQCTTDSCDVNTGQCLNVLAPNACDDSNACTQDWCEPAMGCQHVALQDGKPCEDGNLCTKEESCQEGACFPQTYLECEDYNPCTEDTCDPTKGCVFQVKLNLPCEDGNACTLGDMCNSNGKCSGSAKLDCDDGESCTEDWCEPDVGCKHQTKEDGKQCEDGNACTFGEYCQGGVCTPEKLLDCKDDNPCTNDYCDPETGCVVSLIPEGDPCNDEDACTLGNFCHNGECLYDKMLDCDDGTSCTEDSCDPAIGCIHDVMPDDMYCNDGDFCTKDHCQDGECIGVLKAKPEYLYPTVFDIDQFNWDCYDIKYVGDGKCGLVVKEGLPCYPIDCMKVDGQWKHVSKQPYAGTCTSFLGADAKITATSIEKCKTGCFYQ